MFGKYSKVVPPHQQDLIRQHGLPRPNWYVGAAEQPSSPVDPELRKEIDQIKSDLSGHDRPGSGANAPPSERAASEQNQDSESTARRD